jgi:phytoene dehydrogenase-like protein
VGNKYDHIVFGSGISGMTAALLLAQADRKVLVVEKAAAMGGSMARFYRNGVPFDTGFHFTGGFGENRLLTRMLDMLGIAEKITPLFLSSERAQRIVFEKTGRTYDLPSGIDDLRSRVAEYFPEDRAAIDVYFDRLTANYRSSAELVFQEGGRVMVPLSHDDTVSLQEVLDGLTKNESLKALLSIFCMCYGTKPSEVSFVAHSRVCFSLFESLARVERGGEAFIRAFRSRFRELGVDVLCNTRVEEFGEIENRTLRSFRLSNGDEVGFDSAVLTMHPRQIAESLPRGSVRPAFLNRVNDFEDSTGFFSIFATVEPPDEREDATITSLLPSLDMNEMLTPHPGGESAMVIVRSRENVLGREVHTLTAFEPVSADEVAEWSGTRTGERPDAYQKYKDRRVARMLERIVRACPEYRGRIRMFESASTLTYRDWLNSPTGAAYGIRQKVGQINLVGRLPVSNLHAAGQSALLPGIVGAMMSSFVVCRGILGFNSSPARQPACA